MYDKVRVKKSQKFEVRQDTSQKETKTEETGRVCHLGAARDPWAPPTYTVRAGSDLFGLLLSWDVSRAFGDCLYTVLKTI